jgi:putative membrane protein
MMTRRRLTPLPLAIGAALAMLLTGGCDRAPQPLGAGTHETPSRSADAAASPLDDTDRRILARAAGDGVFHGRVAELAVRKARHPDVKAFAEMMAAHQAAAWQQLQQIAQEHGLALPHTMPHDHRQLLDRLDGLSTPEFERRFVQLIGVPEQRRCIGEFAEAAANAHDRDVQGFAREMLALMRTQLAAAQQLPGALLA